MMPNIVTGLRKVFFVPIGLSFFLLLDDEKSRRTTGLWLQGNKRHEMQTGIMRYGFPADTAQVHPARAEEV